MSKNKYCYRATVSNDIASEYVGSDVNLNNLKKLVRSKYGKGWKVAIFKIVKDSGIMDFPPVDVCTFKIRK